MSLQLLLAFLLVFSSEVFNQNLVKMQKNSRLATIDEWGPLFKVTFDLIIYSKVESKWSSVLAFRGNGAVDDWSKYGDRAPAIFYNKAGFLHFTNAVNGNVNFYFDHDIELNRLYHIEIAQEEKDGQVFYTVKIDGDIIKSVENTDARAFKDVQVFAGDNFYPPTDGSYTNLIWGSCPSGWSEFQGKCYKYFNEQMTWTDARDKCWSHAANLASINSIEENDFVADLCLGELCYLGGRRFRGGVSWVWLDGTSRDFNNWKTGEPNNLGGVEDCMEINWAVHGKWNDQRCDITEKGGFVCEEYVLE